MLSGFLWALPTLLPAADLVMVEEPGCPWCARWTAEIGPIYPKTAEGRAVPLVRMDISEPALDGFALARRVNFTPTFLLVDDGREIDRIEGYPGEELFWWRLSAILNTHGFLEEDDP
ncbi:MAG: hypothetical protein CML68_07675 [Rhodobacteraceae bacterium]|nr:hypothetical protein [Paracoccaceae bacterium]